MSALHQSEPTPEIAECRALQCCSYSGAPPEISTRARQLRIARAVYFCKLHGIEPTRNRLATLSQMERKAVSQLNYEEIIRIYSKKELSTPLWLRHIEPYALREVGCISNYYPNSFSFNHYETMNGLLRYSLNPLTNYVSENTKLKTFETSGVMTMLTSQLLKEFGLLHKLTSHKIAVNVSASVIKLLWATTLQDGKVYHENSALRYLNHYDKDSRIVHKSHNRKCDGLFFRDSKGGNPTTGSYKYHLSREGERFMQLLVKRYLDISLGETKLYINVEDLLVSREKLLNLHTRDQIVLLSRCAGIRDGSYHIVNDISDTQNSRVYGLMTMLTSKGRTTLGFLQYDIAAALQSIVFDVLDAKALYDATKRFPVHFEMIIDRKAFRQKIAAETGKDVAWVKIVLTKIDNGGKVTDSVLSRSDTLMKYVDESRPFVYEFMKYSNKELIRTAKEHTRVYDIENEFIKKEIGIKYDKDGRKTFGFFFFVWTQTEREIRELMKSHFHGYCHDVHDAIATKEDVDVTVLNQEISDAGFKYIKIER